MKSTKSTTSRAAQLLGSIGKFKTYWRPMAVLLLFCALYWGCVLDVENLKVQTAAGGAPVELVAFAFANLLLRLASIAMIILASLRASMKTWLPAVLNVVLAYVSLQAGMALHAYAASTLALVCLSMAWICVDSDKTHDHPVSAG